MSAEGALNPSSLALLGLVPIAIAFVAVALVVDPGRRPSFGGQLEAASEPPVSRSIRRLGRIALRAPGPVPAWFDSATRASWLRSGGRKSEGTGRVEQNAGMAVMGMVAAALVFGIGMRWSALAVLMIGAVGPTLRLRAAARRRQHAIEVAAPGMLELLAVLVAAGLTFRHALARVTERTGGALGDEMRVLLTHMEFGWSPERALADLVHRCSAPTVVRLSVVARQSIELGAPIADSLLALADDARLNYVVQLRVRAERTAVRGVALLMLFAVVPFAVMLVSVLGAISLESLEVIFEGRR
jgi:Flp pilus assembly protein TadB